MDSLLGMDPGDDLEDELSALLPPMPLDGVITGGILGGSNIHGGTIQNDTRCELFVIARHPLIDQ